MTTFIELAPNWKRSLTLNHPVMLVTRQWNASPFGALVTPPLTARSRAAAPNPRVIEIPGGFLFRNGAANPGVSRFIEKYKEAWAKNSAPIIVALAAQTENDWASLAARLERVEGVGGIELHLNPTVDAARAIKRVRALTDLPILAKLDLENARAIASLCVDAGANALVIGRAPRGARMVAGRIWHGRIYGAFIRPIVLDMVNEIVALKLDAPLIACGGVHSTGNVREYLSAGASAVEIDTAHWVDAELVAQVCIELEI